MMKTGSHIGKKGGEANNDRTTTNSHYMVSNKDILHQVIYL